jgi:hypothetical protein
MDDKLTAARTIFDHIATAYQLLGKLAMQGEEDDGLTNQQVIDCQRALLKAYGLIDDLTIHLRK